MFDKQNHQIINQRSNLNMLQNPMAVYLFFQCIIDIVILVTYQEPYFIFHLCKLIIIVIMMIIQLTAQKYIVKYYLEIVFPFINQILIISTIILLDDRDYFLLLLYANIKISTEKSYIKYVLIQTMAYKIGIVCIIIIFFTEPLLIVISISILFLEFFNCVKYIKNTIKTDINIDSKAVDEFPIISNDDNLRDSVKVRENIWKNRIGLLPVSIMLIDKSSLRINYKNITMCQQFISYYQNDQELEELLMLKLKFTIVKADLDFYQSQGKIDARLRINSNLSVSRSHQSDSIEIQKFTLLEIIQKFKEGIYRSLLNSLANSLELNCQHKFDEDNELTYSGLIIDNKEDDEFIVVITDITQQKQIQQFIIKDEFKTKIIESFSHELKTPLNSAINFLNASLQHELIPQQFFTDYIQPAISSLSLQNYLISDVIDFSELNSNNFQLMYAEFTFNDLLEEIQSLFLIQIQMKNIGFHIDMTNNQMDTFNTDYKRLMQILVNVLQNALKFTSSGSIGVSFISLSNNNLKIIVQDKGIGMNYTKLCNMKKFIKTVIYNEDISSFKNWEGFGLLIGQILLKKLAPVDLQSFNIDSKGQNKGTTITFYIQNQNLEVEKRLTVRQFSKVLTKNLKSYSRSYIVLNSSQELNGQKYFKQMAENSMESEECVNLSISQKIKRLELGQPTLITHLQQTSSQKNYVDQNSLQLQQLPSINVSDLNCNFNNNNNTNKNSSHSRFIDKQSFENIRDHNNETQLISIKNNSKCYCKRMMSVDDEIFNQKSVQLLIQKLGFEVILAYNGIQAIDIITNLGQCSKNCQLLQFILMDYQMPIMNGITTTAQLTEMMKQNQLPKIPIIGLTAFTNSADIQNCLEAGMSDVLSKPIKLKELQKILQLI